MGVNRIAAFLDTLRTSQLLPPATVAQLGQSPLAQGDDPAPLARELVRQGQLTPYQVKQLARGGKELVLGPYRLLELVREVGPAQVFKAVHSLMNCTVGLKVVRKDRPGDVAALRRESQITLGLSHPAYLMAYEGGESKDAAFFAFEHVDGNDLEKLVMESGPMPVREACDCVRQAALGMQHAHDRGVILRKLEPSRLLLTQAGTVKFLDLSQAHSNRAGNKPAEAMTGPAEFVAPELLRDPLLLDPRADLYSLGCVFTYLVTGRAPAADGPPPFTDSNDNVPPVVQAIVLKMLNGRAENRFASAGEVATALVPFSRPPASAVNAAPVPAPAPVPPPAPRPVEPPMVTDSVLVPSEVTAITAAVPEPVPARPKKDRSLWLLAAVGVGSLAALLGMGLALDPELNPFAKSAPPPATQPQEVSLADLSSEMLPLPKAEPSVNPRGSGPSVPRTVVTPGSKVGGEANIKPEMKPEPKPMVVPLPKVEPKPEVKPRPKLMAVPDIVKQAEAEKLIKETYAPDYANPKKKPAEFTTVATKFLKEAGETLDNPTVQYVLYREAGDFAARAGDLDLVIRSLDEMGGRFAINVFEMKISSLTRASQATVPPTTSRAIAEIALELAGEALDEDNYATVARLLEISEAAAKKAGGGALLIHIQKRTKDIAELAKEYAVARTAADILKIKPLDPEASYKWGRFIAFYKGNWGAGLPLLSRGSDEMLVDLADKDLSNPDTAAAQLRLADLWYDHAMNLSGIPKKQVLLRASHWYEQAAPMLAGFNKTRVEKRIKEIEQMAPRDELALERTAIANVSINEKYNRLIAGGHYAFRGGNYPRAAEAFAEAIKLKPDDSKATALFKEARYYQHMTAGYILGNLGQLPQSAQQFEQALEFRPGDAVATNALTAVTQASTSGNKFSFGKTKGKGGKN